MARIQHDENMKIAASINKPDVRFYNIEEEPFRIYGVWREGNSYCRVPGEVAKTVSNGIYDMHTSSAGGRVRFVTDSPYVAIKVEYGAYELSSTIPHLAMVGFDMYADGEYAGAFRPPLDFYGSTMASVVELYSTKPRLITINFPLYAEVKSMCVGVADGSEIQHAPDYTHEKPVVFYGSSITNGAAASRPGATYTSRLSRELDFNYHCLGFGGLAKGEESFAKYISTLDMSAFVLDYDHNAPTLEHLQETHERFFKTVREKNPTLPIVIISMPTNLKNRSVDERFAIIKKTYDNAIAAGDKNVYLIRGTDLLDGGTLDYTVDTVHPSDLGFYMMAKGISPILKSILEK